MLYLDVVGSVEHDGFHDVRIPAHFDDLPRVGYGTLVKVAQWTCFPLLVLSAILPFASFLPLFWAAAGLGITLLATSLSYYGYRVGFPKVSTPPTITPFANMDWLEEAKNQDQLRRFLRASQRGWQYSFDNRAEAAEIFRKAAPAFTQEIALLEVDGTMSIIRTERTKGRAIAWSDAGDWRDSQDLLSKFAKLTPQADLNRYFTNEYLSEAPYMPKK